MSNLVVVFLAVAVATGAKEAPTVVAVSPCIVGPGVSLGLGGTVTEMVVGAVGQLAGVRLLDRSQTAAVVREQDLVLISRATEVLPRRFGELGAEQVLTVGLWETSAGFVLSLRLIDVATGEVHESAVHQLRSRNRLLAECGGYAKDLWETEATANSPQEPPRAVDAVLKDMWRQLDDGEARRLVGSDLDRAESVYRQYVRAVQSRPPERVNHLAEMAGIYLTDCISSLQRALDPPEGMVYVPPGWVTIALRGSEARRFWVAGFFIDRCAYTRVEYAGLLDATARGGPLGWSDPGKKNADLPVAGVDWYDAGAAAEWRGMRLPTYPQWLRAVQGERPLRHPWGDTWRAERCNFASDPLHMVLEPVGSHPENASQFGMLDGVGGVFEWLDTWYGSSYWNDAPERNPAGPAQGSAKMAVGGSFRSPADGCRCTSIQQLGPGTRKDDLGFRCVLPLKASSGDPGLRRPDGLWEGAVRSRR